MEAIATGLLSQFCCIFCAESGPFSPFGRLPPHELAALQADRTSPQADTESMRSTHQLVSTESSVGQTDCFDSDKLKTAAFHLDNELRPPQPFLQSSELDLIISAGRLKQDPAAEMSPSKSSELPDIDRKPSKKSPTGAASLSELLASHSTDAGKSSSSHNVEGIRSVFKGLPPFISPS